MSLDPEIKEVINAILKGKSPREIENWPQKIDQLREVMCTLPERQGKREDKVYFGVKHIKVELVDYPENPYKAIYTMVTSTWGNRHEWWKRWENATPEGRLLVVLAALSRQTLPQCLEAATFTFKIQGLSRAAYDQLARHRHAGIGSVGSRDNCHLDAALVVPNTLKKFEKELREWWKMTKDLYEKIIKEGKRTWQCARFILPLGMEWRFTWCLNYRGLQDMMAQRLAFHEQWDSVTGDTEVVVFSPTGVMKKLTIRELWEQYAHKAVVDEAGREVVRFRRRYIDTFAIDMNTGKLKIAPIRAIYKHRVKKRLYRITTESGKSVIVTEDHSLLAYHNGKIVEVKPSNFNIAEMLIPVLDV